MYPSPEVAQHSEKDDDSSSSEKNMAAEGLCSLGQTVSSKGKPVASKTANASHSKKHDVANDKTTVRKSSGKVLAVHLDNISFHLEDGAGKWKFVIQRRVVVERELGKDVVEVKEVMDLIKTVGLMKTVVGFSQCYEGLVKEFIVNIPKDIADKNNKESCKVFVRGKCITFSPTVINNFLGRKVEGAGELAATNNEVCREITARQVKGWPIKKHLPAGKLTVKYAILHKIGTANWVPTNHISTIANTLGRFIFVVGTKMNFDYASKVGTITELKETCKELGEGIRVATTRKQSLEALIASLEQTAGESIDHAKEAEAHTTSERSATNDETIGNSVSSADEAASSSSSD
ncbi:uncharacterized protein LOC127136765 [Lathyrus oleraceus]|uniref:uncharacterized protein LOC127136765 n=1 Tax=Pisum sativum TaxID=3888 RepID=UPI0021D0EAD1|nr:uncharacterized protein LOC127136765 [Pisum sativum]